MLNLSLVFIFGLFICCHGISRWDVFSTKTIYKWAHDVNVAVDQDLAFTSGNTGTMSCKAIHVNLVSRHGARWPSESKMDGIEELHELIVSLNPASFYTWTPRYNRSDEKQLADEGKSEQQEIGARTGKRFKTLFDNNGKYIKFVSSSKARTKDSNEHFYKGLSTVIANLPVYANSEDNSVVRFYDDCEGYENEVESDSNLKQFIDFTKSAVFVNIADSVKTKLGISVNLTDDDITLIYTFCAYEKYLYGTETVWCELLTDDERLVMNYREDLESYYELSYGNLMNSEISCPLISDMFHTMDAAINTSWDYTNLGNVTDSGYLAGKFYNGHSETLLTLLTALGLFKDDQHLLATNMDSMVDREFSTSTIDPSSANIAFVLYVCDDSVSTDRSFMVKLFANEEPIPIPGCGADACLYDTVRQRYGDLIDKCNIEPICDTDDDDDDDDDDRDPSAAAGPNGGILVALAPLLFSLIIFY